MLVITTGVRDQIVAHALRSRPDEACGLVTAPGPDRPVDRFHPLNNIAASPERFVVDPAGMLAVERDAHEDDRSIIGIVHSHTRTDAWPSPTDISDSANYDPDGTYRQLIVSLRAAAVAIRSYRIVDDTVHEELVIVDEPEPTTHDQAGAGAAVVALARPTASDT